MLTFHLVDIIPVGVVVIFRQNITNFRKKNFISESLANLCENVISVEQDQW